MRLRTTEEVWGFQVVNMLLIVFDWFCQVWTEYWGFRGFGLHLNQEWGIWFSFNERIWEFDRRFEIRVGICSRLTRELGKLGNWEN